MELGLRPTYLPLRPARDARHWTNTRLRKSLTPVLDNCSGVCFGPSSVRGSDRCLVGNDNQVRRVTIEKQENPKGLGDDAGGRTLIRPYRPRRWPLQSTKGDGLLKNRKGRCKSESNRSDGSTG